MTINAKTRKIGIIIAVILGSIAGIYLSGLMGQLMTGYNTWLEEDGILGNATMPAISFDFFYCVRNTFTAEGLKGAALLGVVAVGLILVYILHNRFGTGKPDDRNFRRSARGTYGTAGWMEPRDMKRVLEISTPHKARGTILGEKDGKLLCIPENTNLSKHIAVFGSTGTMKSRAFVRNQLLQAIRRGESVVCTDPKIELHDDLVELFRKNDYTVKIYNLVMPEHSDSWNCMAGLNGDTLTAQILTDVIIENTVEPDAKKDHFWDYNETNLLKALVLYTDLDPSRGPEQKHLPAVYQMITQYSEKQLIALFDKLPISHPAKAPFNLFKNCSDNVRAGVMSGLGTRLQVMQSSAIKQITSSSGIDLTLPGKKKCAYFIILSDQDTSLSFISSLFFSSLFMKLARYADSTKAKRCKVPVNVILEELNTTGSINALNVRISSLRSRAIFLTLVCQGLGQLQNRYPRNRWSEILGNVDIQIMMGCTDAETASYFSDRSGDMTVEVNSNMMTRKTIAIAQIIPEYRAMEGTGRRKVLTPDECLRLPNEELLIVLRGENILKANKFDYSRHPMAKELVPASITDYYGTCPAPPSPIDLPAVPEASPAPGKPIPDKTVTIPAPGTAPLYGSARPPDGF